VPAWPDRAAPLLSAAWRAYRSTAPATTSVAIRPTKPKAASPPGARVGAKEGGPVRVLVVEDTREYRELVAKQLGNEGFAVDVAQDGGTAVELARTREPDVIVLDLGLPHMDGVEVCRQVRTFSQAYVVMLTGRDDEVDKLVGLSVGADDYMTKPFSARELVARVRAMLRRPRPSSNSSSERRVGELTIDPGAREVRNGNVKVELTRIEFDLLDALSERPRLVFSRSQLLERIWGENWYGDDHVVDVHVSSLRRKIGDDPQSSRFIRTVRGSATGWPTGARPRLPSRLEAPSVRSPESPPYARCADAAGRWRRRRPGSCLHGPSPRATSTGRRVPRRPPKRSAT
jgi:DNA-binding response OmpR family regulator